MECAQQTLCSRCKHRLADNGTGAIVLQELFPHSVHTGMFNIQGLCLQNHHQPTLLWAHVTGCAGAVCSRSFLTLGSTTQPAAQHNTGSNGPVGPVSKLWQCGCSPRHSSSCCKQCWAAKLYCCTMVGACEVVFALQVPAQGDSCIAVRAAQPKQLPRLVSGVTSILFACMLGCSGNT
jgi:hypothetical protein